MQRSVLCSLGGRGGFRPLFRSIRMFECRHYGGIIFGRPTPVNTLSRTRNGVRFSACSVPRSNTNEEFCAGNKINVLEGRVYGF